MYTPSTSFAPIPSKIDDAFCVKAQKPPGVSDLFEQYPTFVEDYRMTIGNRLIPVVAKSPGSPVCQKPTLKSKSSSATGL